MAYNPSVPPQLDDDLLPFLQDELLRIAQAFNDITEGQLGVRHTMPLRYKPGTLLYLSGGPQANPLGTGKEGLYYYTSANQWKYVGDTSGPSPGGAVDSVNGKTGVVTLTAADVQAEPSGAVSTAMSTHTGAADPHVQYVLKTSLSAVATSGAYGDLTGKPTLFSGRFPDLTDVPNTLAAHGITDTYRALDIDHKLSERVSGIVLQSQPISNLNEGSATWGFKANYITNPAGVLTNDGCVMSMNYNAGWSFQILGDFRNGNMFTSTVSGGVRQPTRQVAFMDNLPVTTVYPTGTVIKHPSGVMEIFFYEGSKTFAVATSVTLTWVFPEKFVGALPVISFGGAGRLAGAIQAVTKQEYGQTVSQALVRLNTVSVNGMDDIRDVTWRAIGRWKA